ncbi:MAG: ketoacyl-ACP synthase III [Oligoflexia bacterium]|nr:ketoacyl-ACP synthase III [Oligoflexia bacterium]
MCKSKPWGANAIQLGQLAIRNAKITGVGMYAPDKVVKNQYFNERYGVDVDTFLREKRNIFERRYMAEDQTTSDLIVPAAQQAMKMAGITADQLDLIIVATDTPDYLSPSTAAVVQHKLQARNSGTFDINAACAGFVTGLDIGTKYIKADDRYRNILVVGAYGMTKFLNWDDFKIASLFADGAGAVVLQPTNEPEEGVQATQLFTDGQYHSYMGIYGGGTFRPITKEVVEMKGHLLDFAKKIPLDLNSTHWSRLVQILLDRTGQPVSEVKKYFITQINIGSINETLDKLGVDHKLAHNIMDRYGYTGSACIPMALADAAEKGAIRKGDLIMLVGSGGGLAMAAAAVRWSI